MINNYLTDFDITCTTMFYEISGVLLSLFYYANLSGNRAVSIAPKVGWAHLIALAEYIIEDIKIMSGNCVWMK